MFFLGKKQKPCSLYHTLLSHYVTSVLLHWYINAEHCLHPFCDYFCVLLQTVTTSSAIYFKSSKSYATGQHDLFSPL